MKTNMTVYEVLGYVRSLDDRAFLRLITRYRLMLIHEMDDHLGLPPNIIMNDIDIDTATVKTIQDLYKLISGGEEGEEGELTGEDEDMYADEDMEGNEDFGTEGNEETPEGEEEGEEATEGEEGLGEENEDEEV